MSLRSQTTQHRTLPAKRCGAMAALPGMETQMYHAVRSLTGVSHSSLLASHTAAQSTPAFCPSPWVPRGEGRAEGTGREAEILEPLRGPRGEGRAHGRRPTVVSCCKESDECFTLKPCKIHSCIMLYESLCPSPLGARRGKGVLLESARFYWTRCDMRSLTNVAHSSLFCVLPFIATTTTGPRSTQAE